MLSELIAELARTAPGVEFEILSPESRTIELLERGEADLLITIDTNISSNFPKISLFEEEHAVICWTGSRYSAGIDAKAFSAAGHAISYFGPAQTQAFSEIFLEREGIARRVEIRVPSFTMLPEAVIGTERLATLQRRYAQHWARLLPITVLSTPFEMPKLREVAQWHSMRETDAGLKWLVTMVRERAAQV